MTNDHVHDCTGPDATCPCGYKLEVARFQVSIEVWDNLHKRAVVTDAFGTDSVGAVEAGFHRAVALVASSASR